MSVIMKQNKVIKYCLTLNQAKELQALGIRMDSSILFYTNMVKDSYGNLLLNNWKLSTDEPKKIGLMEFEKVYTLTNTEMLEIMPKRLYSGEEEYNLTIECTNIGRYMVGYRCQETKKITLACFADLLRDGLYNVIERLKTKELM